MKGVSKQRVAYHEKLMSDLGISDCGGHPPLDKKVKRNILFSKLKLTGAGRGPILTPSQNLNYPKKKKNENKETYTHKHLVSQISLHPKPHSTSQAQTDIANRVVRLKKTHNIRNPIIHIPGHCVCVAPATRWAPGFVLSPELGRPRRRPKYQDGRERTSPHQVTSNVIFLFLGRDPPRCQQPKGALSKASLSLSFYI